MAYLTQYSSSVPVIKFNIDQSLMTIGQDIEMDICVPEDGISESHATIEVIKEAQSYRFVIKSNIDEPLLELNGAATSQAELNDNDWIMIGGVEFQFTDDGVNDIKEISKPVVSHLTVVEPIVSSIQTKTPKTETISVDEPRPMTTKEYVAKSRYSRRRLAF